LVPLVTFFLVLILSPLVSGEVKAEGSLYIEKYDVNVTVNDDSTFDVSETISYRATGEFSRIYREITLQDYEAVEQCQRDSSLQCGGFSYITVTAVYDSKGNKLPESAYTLEVISKSYEDRLKVQWVYAPDGRYFNDELFTWTVEYKVYGGLGYFSNYDLFYWDVFYPDRSYIVEEASLSITFPEDIEFSEDNLKVVSQGPTYEYEYSYDEEDYILSLEAYELAPREDFTVLLKFPKGITQEYATLNLNLRPKTQDFWIDDIKIILYYNKSYVIRKCLRISVRACRDAVYRI